MTAADEHLAEGKICSHTSAMFRSKKLAKYEILQCLYVDDGAFPFGTREDLQRGMELVYRHFARFGMKMHIGRGSLELKTECVFSPPPQFFQHLERSNDAASIVQYAFRQAQRTCTAYSATLEHTHQAQNPPTSNSLTLLPANFPIGSHVTVVLSHPKHANAIGIVTRHTAKFVTFSPVDSPKTGFVSYLSRYCSCHSQQSSLRSPATVRRPRGVPHSHTLQTIKVGCRGKQNATTTHMTNSRKQRTSMLRTDMSASLEPFAILAPSSTTVSAMTMISLLIALKAR
jgi:hypothetical protein